MPLSAYQPECYEDLLVRKTSAHRPAFEALGAPEPEIVGSPHEGFRLRVEFRLWHEGERMFYAMFRPGAPKQPIPIERFPIAAPAIQRLMPKLLAALHTEQSLRQKLFQVEFLSTLAGDMLVTLIYHRALDEAWTHAATALATDLEIKLVGRSRKQKLIIGGDWVQETLQVNDRSYQFKQPEQAFSQPNGKVNEKMLAWAMAASRELHGDLLELYCGIGIFTLPLSGCYDRILATEVSKVATRAANENLAENGIGNVALARLSAEEMTQALTGVRPFRRLASLPVPLEDYRLDTLLVDPPRAGLDSATLELACGFTNVIYISCNPTTLLENLGRLTRTHSIDRLAFFDQFPYTPHLESGVLLRRRGT